jgi:diaminohydroxyphosphoribosylaminopyrimidine deaminase / 5-amino-6-(5-phosphoribosylamino)uracil reductase
VAIWQTPEALRDQRFMRESLNLAQRMLGFTTPNPAVGCVIVQGGKIVGHGATAPGGRPHAETQALAMAGARSRGATAYVSLEPCAHQGQTPPCARALIEAGIMRVVAGCQDPFPAVRGRGLAMLRRAGIVTKLGVLEEECLRVNEGFFTRVTLGRPFVILKLAMSLDGRIAAASGDSRWISSSESRQMVHRWRREADAVMVGAGTVIADNPRLTCRIEDGRDPVRIVVDGRLRCPPGATIFRQRSKAPTILVTTSKNAGRARRRYTGKQTEVIGAASDGDGVSLAGLMREFGERGWAKVLIEGGAHLAAAAMAAGIVDRLAIFVSPRIIGAGLSAVEGLRTASVREGIELREMKIHEVGPDWLVEAVPKLRAQRHSGRKGR